MIIRCSSTADKNAHTISAPTPYFYTRRLSQLSVSILLLGSSVTSRAQEAESAVDTPIESASVGEAVQAAENAKQRAQEQLKRLAAMPASTATNSKPVLANNTTSNNLPAPSSDLPANTEITQAPSDAQAAVDNRKEEQEANAALEQAREQTQISTADADAEKKQATDAANESSGNSTASSSTSSSVTPPLVKDESIQTQANQTESNQTQTSTKKPNVIKRLWYRFRPPKEDLAAPLPTISVQVVGAPELLSKNIKGKLEQYTVEAFEDFRSSLAQLRGMAKEASEAVGYYTAEFRFEQINSNTLRVVVTPHDPVIVKSQRIKFEGEANEDNSFKRVQEQPDLKVGDTMNDQLYETTKSRIAAVGTDKGYFDSYWKMHDVKVTLPDNTADIKLDYYSGDRYKLGKVEFKNTDPNKPLPVDLDLLEKLLPFKEGDDYGSWKVNNLSRNVSDTRYFNSVQVDTIIPDPIVKAHDLPDDVIEAKKQQQLLEGNPPQQMTVEPIQTVADESQFAGAKTDPEAALQRSAQIQQVLSEAEKREQERVKLAAEVRQTRIIPVTVSVNADKPNSAEAGIGYGTDTGIRLRSQYRKALINSRGHNLDSNFELSQIRQAVDVRYNLPYKHPLEDTISVFGGFEREEKGSIGDSLGLNTQSATVGMERAIKPKNGDWQHTMSVRYRLDQLQRETDNSVNQAELPPPFNIDNSRFEQQSLLFGYGLNKVYTVGRIDPTRAFRQFYQVEVGSESLLTDTDLAILRAGWRFIYSFGEDNNHQVVGRADAGTILTRSFEDVPYNLRFFAGGDQSVRGYDYKSLSTKQNGYLIGGQNLGVGSLEYNYQFIPKWRGAVFVDGGNAFDKNFNDPIKVGAGFGVRWSSPVGPIRVDVAAGVSESNLPIRLHFFIGPQL
jgi:translocation and assembly module TamA